MREKSPYITSQLGKLLIALLYGQSEHIYRKGSGKIVARTNRLAMELRITRKAFDESLSRLREMGIIASSRKRWAYTIIQMNDTRLEERHRVEESEFTPQGRDLIEAEGIWSEPRSEEGEGEVAAVPGG